MSETELGIANLTDLEPIGHGGFSVVYAATNTQFDRRVAVKVLNRLSSEADQRRFERECRVMGRLSAHRNVVNVYSAGYTGDGRPYIEMELIEGGTLAERVQRSGPMPWRQAVEQMIAIGGALGEAHAADILHRDVKPENILLAGDEPRLTDFGIAYLRDATGAASTQLSASWLHSPPETFDNRRDERSDLYSLGSTLHTIIAGSPPFWRSNDESLSPLMYRLLNEPPPRLSPELAPTELADFVVGTLAKDPDHRPQTAVDFGAALQRIVDIAPGSAQGANPAVGANPTVISSGYEPPSGQPNQTQFANPAQPNPAHQATAPEATTPSPPVMPPPSTQQPTVHAAPAGPGATDPQAPVYDVQGLAGPPTGPPTMHAAAHPPPAGYGQPPAVSGAPPTNFVAGPPGGHPGQALGGMPVDSVAGGGVPLGGAPPTGFGPPASESGGGGRGRYVLAGALLGLLVLVAVVGVLLATMGDDAPGPVTALTVTEGDGQLTIDFDAPIGVPVERYEVSINDGDWEPLPESRQLTGLSNGTTYSVRVRAVNAEGPGDPGVAAPQRTPYGRPAPPSVTGSASGAILNWSWNEPDGNGRPVSGYWVQFDDGEQVFQTETTFQSTGQLGPLEEHRLTVWTVNDGDDDDRNTSQPETVAVRTNGSATSVLVQRVGAFGDGGVELIREPQTVEHLLDGDFAWRVSCQFLGPEYVSIYWQMETRLVGDEIVVDITERLRYDAVNGSDLFGDMCERDEEVTLVDQHSETHRFPIADGTYELDTISLAGAGAVSDSTDRTLTITLNP